MNQNQSFPKTPSMKRGNFSKSLSLRNRLLLAFILLAILPVLITGTVAGLISAQGLRNQVFTQLESLSSIKETEIKTLLNVLQTNLDLISEDQAAQQNIVTLLQNNPSVEVNKNELRNELISFNKKTGYFIELFIMDQDGKIVISTDNSQEGKIQANQAFFTQGKLDSYIAPPAYEVALSNYSIVISQPVKNNNGKIIGVLAGRVNLSTLNAIMQESAGIQESTGINEGVQTYLVSVNYAVLTNIRHGEFKLGETYNRTEGVTNAIKNKSNGSGNYIDYDGETVFGVYRWIPELQIALIAEHHQAEALQPSTAVFRTTIGLISVTVLVAIIVAFFVTQSITSPITKLVTIAENIARGNFELQADIPQKDEIGVLAQAFNTMTFRLRDLIGTLEQRVTDRTKALATTTEVSRRLSTILNRKELVTEVVNQVRDSFGYQHTQIYFYDEATEYLIMAGGTGEAGDMLLAQFHKVAKGRGLVGRAAENNQAMLVSDTSQNPDWLPNALLPDTKSEVAIPISIGNQVLGVLDVQDNIIDGLQQEDIDSLQSIANQVAVALQNIRQYENTQKIAADMGVVANVGIATSTITESGRLLQEVVDLSKKSFNLYHVHIYLLNEAGDSLELTSGAGEVGRQMISEKRSIPLDSEQSLVARAARTREGVVVNDVTVTPDFLPNPLLPDTRSEMAVPMIVADKVIGVLDVQSETVNRFTAIDISIQTTLASQVSVALQNARSFSQTQRLAERETAVNLITQKIQSTTSVEAALQITARELGHVLGMKSTLVALDPTELSGERQTINEHKR